MIIDRIHIAGIRSYLQDPTSPGDPELAGANPIVARTPPLGKGQQWKIGGLCFTIEADDLGPFFDRQSEPPTSPPLFSVSIQKEILPGLFADPYQHRIHNIAGFDDFKRGTFENCQAIDVDGVPTLVSLGSGDCKWVSPIFEMPTPASFDLAGWELAASRKSPRRSFTYSIILDWWAVGQSPSNPPTTTTLVSSAGPTGMRFAKLANIANVAFIRVRFNATIRNDGAIQEKHTAIVGESIGRPLLRGISLLQPIVSANDFYTLDELLARCPQYHLFEIPGAPLKKLWACLNLSATLVNSPNQPANPGDDYEFIQVATAGAQFSHFQARLLAEELVRPHFV